MFYEKHMATEGDADALWVKNGRVKVMSTSMLSESPETKKKQHTKKKKEGPAEYAKLLVKRVKYTKENHQEQTVMRHRLSSLRTSISTSKC
ncbi:hypothetical protein A6R68_11753, partial [Neotoma lepida]